MEFFSSRPQAQHPQHLSVYCGRVLGILEGAVAYIAYDAERFLHCREREAWKQRLAVVTNGNVVDGERQPHTVPTPVTEHAGCLREGLEQKLHFAQVFKVIELMGNDYAKNLIHIPYGLVSLKSGKISSRKGNVIFAEDLLRESINKTTSIIDEKNPDIPDKEEVAKQVGIGAIIFNDLYNQRIKDVIFDWEKLLNFDGETGPYVQYTYARASSVLRKIGEVPDTIDYNLLIDEASIGLLKEIERYPQIIKDAADRYEPSVIARYSIDLAHAFNKFYHECQINVEDETTKYTRTNVVKIVRYIIKDALSLLGIQCPEQM